MNTGKLKGATQREYVGEGVLDRLGDILADLSPVTVLIVHGRGSYQCSGAESALRSLHDDYQISTIEFRGGLLTLDELTQGVLAYKKSRPDVVIAIGGGSVIDLAKSINALAFQRGPILPYLTSERELTTGGRLLIALPTTSGTGSESTHFATVYNNGRKYSLSHREHVLPDIAIVDPLLSASMPPNITASTGLDALSQGIESYWSTQSTEESRSYAIKAIDLAWNYLKDATLDPNQFSRNALAQAAHFSGKAINISFTTASHSISYPLTSRFNIPHGLAVALTIGDLLVFNAAVSEDDCTDSRGASFVHHRIRELCESLNTNHPTEARDSFRALIGNLGFENTLENAGFSTENIPIILKEGFIPTRLKNNPRSIKRDDMEQIMQNILKTEVLS